MTRPIVTYDTATCEFIASSPDWPGNAVARSSNKQLLEDFLDWLENRERLANQSVEA